MHYFSVVRIASAFTNGATIFVVAVVAWVPVLYAMDASKSFKMPIGIYCSCSFLSCFPVSEWSWGLSWLGRLHLTPFTKRALFGFGCVIMSITGKQKPFNFVYECILTTVSRWAHYLWSKTQSSNSFFRILLTLHAFLFFKLPEAIYCCSCRQQLLL